MKIVATILVGVAVIVAAALSLGCAICAFVPNMPTAGRAISVFVGVVCLAVVIGGVALIAAIHKRPREPRDLL